MLQVSYIRDNREKVLERLAVKNFKQPQLVDDILKTDFKLREFKTKLDIALHESKFLSSQIPQLKKNKSPQSEIETILLQISVLKEQEPEFKRKVNYYAKKLDRLIVKLPNLPHKSVPRGKTPEENQIVLESGFKPILPTNSLPHWELAKKYNLIDFELGVKITGAGFPVYKGKGAKLQRALIAYFLDEAEKAGYAEVMLPLMVNKASGFGTGQLPDKEGQMYYVKKDDLYLIPTAEVPITNLYRDVILKADELPVKNCGYTACFRREAGSYGAHVRGLNRLHQFDKVEIVQVVHPDDSYRVLESMSAHVQGLLQNLGLPYRVLRLCGGDMGFASALTYDMETWSAAQQRWLEVSSVSNFETFQTNRLKLRFRNAEGKTQLAHTLNGSALALPRIVATLLENNQTDRGIKIPEVLVPYTRFEWID
ncbi:seryl-tRNA synthetase [Mucilaginibacter mallensis]|uniref:Serine--tRNA ligase n=1 Tax=Mucilaginibacter mallensis TaxID=652787 RepID=A0A1H1P647_MUCMA|nr:serine--tRNA ligase [Mucilaginibacter mallensis]SDS06465.1 seryl-tRNA synthetase [Mucilaginibacter mallensis]